MLMHVDVRSTILHTLSGLSRKEAILRVSYNLRINEETALKIQLIIHDTGMHGVFNNESDFTARRGPPQQQESRTAQRTR